MPKANKVQFPDFIPEGQEYQYPAMGAGNLFCDFVPEHTTSAYLRRPAEDEPALHARMDRMRAAKAAKQKAREAAGDDE